jgi:hypothetical protein
MEQAISALISTIENNYQTYLDIDSEVGYELTTPSKVIMSSVDLDKYNSKCVCFILPDKEEFDEDNMLGEDLSRQNLSVYIFIKKDTKEKLTTKIIRYGRSFRRMIKADNTLGNKVGYVHVNSAEYIEGVEGSDLIKGIVLNLSVIDEDYI